VQLDNTLLIIDFKIQPKKGLHKMIIHSSHKSTKNPKKSKEIDQLKMFYMKKLLEEKQKFNKKKRKSTNNQRSK
jgi:hypothetical protein